MQAERLEHVGRFEAEADIQIGADRSGRLDQVRVGSAPPFRRVASSPVRGFRGLAKVGGDRVVLALFRVHQLHGCRIGADRSDRQPVERDRFEQSAQKFGVAVQAIVDRHQRHQDRADRISGCGRASHRFDPCFDRRRVRLPVGGDRREVDRPRQDRLAAMLQIQQVFDVGRLGQEHLIGMRMLREERDQATRVTGQRVQGQSVLQLAMIERRGSGQCPGLPVDRREHFVEVQKDLHRRREPHARRPGQIAVGAAVGAESVEREVPVVRAGVSFFLAESE